MPTQQISITCLFLPPLPTAATTTTAPVLSSFALGREGGVEILRFEAIKLTCRMEAAREERNRINQPPNPSTYTHTLRRNGLAFTPAGTSRSAHYGSTCGVLRVPNTSPDMHQRPPRQEGAPNPSGGLPGQLQRGQLLQGVSRAPRSPLWRFS